VSDFDRALPLILREEGGFVNDPDDPGGATNYGITERTYHGWLQSRNLPLKPVREIHPGEVHQIYEARFWLRARCDALTWPLSWALFDACVNHGTEPRDARGTKKVSGIVLLQRAAGVLEDGIFGKQTLAAIESMGPRIVFHRLLLERVFRYDELVDHNPRLAKFLTGGWLTRLERLYREAA
jgi:lysozyme family protein